MFRLSLTPRHRLSESQSRRTSQSPHSTRSQDRFPRVHGLYEAGIIGRVRAVAELPQRGGPSDTDSAGHCRPCLSLSWTSPEWQRWCAARVPARVRNQLRVECQVAARHAHHRRASRSQARGIPVGVDQLSDRASLYTVTDMYLDPPLARSHPALHIYELLPPSHQIDDMLTELDSDLLSIFLG